MLSQSDALKYYQNKRDFRQAAEVNAVLKPQLLSFYPKNSFRPTLGPNVAAIICEIQRYWAILEKIFKIHGDIRRYWAI